MNTYADIDTTLSRISSPLLPEEIHGLACGMLTAGCKPHHAWLEEIVPEHEPGNALVNEAKQNLETFYETLHTQLDDKQLRFTLLLPDDEESLTDRLEALIEWVRSFTHGLVLAQPDDFHLSPQAQEVIDDFIQITRAPISFNEDEENETALQEIIEYIRVGMQLVYEESQT